LGAGGWDFLVESAVPLAPNKQIQTSLFASAAWSRCNSVRQPPDLDDRNFCRFLRSAFILSKAEVERAIQNLADAKFEEGHDLCLF